MAMFDKVSEINKILADQGARAVQKKPGLGNRPALYGYLPQIVFDAVNQVVGPENWSSIVSEHFLNERQVIVLVTVKMFGTERTQFGESGVVKGDEGSAHKGGVTDAIQKAFALFGIGAAAYRGELKNVFDGKVSMTLDTHDLAPLQAQIRKLKTRTEATTWWKINLKKIQTLSTEDRGKIVKALGDKK